jgi:NAD(P)-dependent dehydrogenase (short-subunit alcohol dehydrogenase family)
VLTARNADTAERRRAKSDAAPSARLRRPLRVRGQRLFREVEQRTDGADVLVNNAGIGKFGPRPTCRSRTGAR